MKIIILIVSFAFLSTSCTLVSRKEMEAQRDKKTRPKTSTTTTPTMTEEELEEETQIYKKAEQDAPQRQRPKVAVILGPGGFKTFAYASFVKGLQKSGVPVDQIVGMGWGSLVGGFWALNGLPHEAEWKVFKLDESLFNSGSFFKTGSSATQADKLRPYLKENLTDLDLRKLKIKFTCPVLSLKSGSVKWPRTGSLAQTVQACLTSPPQMSPENIKSSNVAALMSAREIAQRLKREAYGVILFVNVLGDGEILSSENEDWVTRAYWSEVRRSIWMAKNEFTDVIDLNTSSTSLFDFRAKKAHSGQADSLGKRIGQELVNKYKF